MCSNCGFIVIKTCEIGEICWKTLIYSKTLTIKSLSSFNFVKNTRNEYQCLEQYTSEIINHRRTIMLTKTRHDTQKETKFCENLINWIDWLSTKPNCIYIAKYLFVFVQFCVFVSILRWNRWNKALWRTLVPYGTNLCLPLTDFVFKLEAIQ